MARAHDGGRRPESEAVTPTSPDVGIAQLKTKVWFEGSLQRAVEAFRLAEKSDRPVVCPAAVVAGSRHCGVIEAFIELLVSPGRQAALARHGCRPPLPGLR